MRIGYHDTADLENMYHVDRSCDIKFDDETLKCYVVVSFTTVDSDGNIVMSDIAKFEGTLHEAGGK